MLTDGFDYVVDATAEDTDELGGVILEVLGSLSCRASSLGSSVSYLTSLITLIKLLPLSSFLGAEPEGAVNVTSSTAYKLKTVKPFSQGNNHKQLESSVYKEHILKWDAHNQPE